MIKMATVWDRTTGFLGDNLAAVLPLALLAIFLPTSMQDSFAAFDDTAMPGARLAVALLAIALTGIILWGHLAIAAMAIEGGGDRARPMALATRRLLPAIGVMIVAGLLALLLLIPSAIVAAAFGVDVRALATMPAGAMPEAAKLPLALCVLVTVPIALWALARVYLLLTPVIVAERRGIAAIGRAFALSRGLTWRIIGVILLYAVVSAIAQLAAKVVFGSVFELVAGGSGPLSLAKILTSIVSGAVSCAFTVVAAVFCAKLYRLTSDQDDLPLP